MSLAKQALNAYRGALRATSVAFNSDVAMLQAARAQIKAKMVLEVDPDMPDKSVEDRIKHLNDVSMFLRRNIVQGRKEEDEENKYFLNIHEDTELGDNDDIKKKKGSRNPFGGGMASGGCCGGGEIKMNERRG
ncbi:hypothetical protein KL921_003343 [Ogataea angusta]|uniref:Mitochondrial zinc maintenance protein 1, mitochondrial n=1 Tax=Pichia angusta TaxID=870730 RepID=A0AAN6DD77_PICAN|nr:uncharacterized protein KL928_003581 [Ogataea angusta]KAG7809346.1 hypothetical protein KL921_003343 [Ogataea angusta]KAG7817682.1 hypothetical protein KL928_003581 [Ogataea angusta]KAG7822629.1 hypothetical protein KL909_003794 [Ogataea angusta]KAG7827572.1 hypothetical protein KL920_004335 [Ogataea angusta]KAG7833714.1 hypothetical protein KL943_003822 [Ogataea angusta]